MTSSSSRNRVLVLMRDASVEEKQIFVADLYFGNTVEDRVLWQSAGGRVEMG